jgi:S-adenosylmethionine:tRNA ribosyltransferase-isomerase
MRVDEFDFELPEERIALRPARPRDSARLLWLRGDGRMEDRIVREAPSLLRRGDLLVFNNTRVIPARLSGVRVREESSVSVEATLMKRLSTSRWTAFAKPGKRLKEGDRIRFGMLDDRACLMGALDASVEAKGEEGQIALAFDLAGADLDAAIAAAGAMPLPPYIAGKRAPDDADQADYQTMFAARDGAVAAPTAGLHFTPELMGALGAAGVERATLTLHVGTGTFLPMRVDDTDAHVMHAEWFQIDAGAAAAINTAKVEGRRVIPVGTTALRSLESAADETGQVRETSGETSIFITPGYRFKICDALWTNFHLPRSTLFMLVASLAGLDRMKAAYAHAIASGYRFYSYGDACLIEPGQEGSVT